MPTTEETLYKVQISGAWITLNRREKRNALSPTLIAEVYEHILAVISVVWSAGLFKSEEGAEGMAAFHEKRKPDRVNE